MTTPFSDLEAFYEALAKALDDVPPPRRELFLAKLALKLAHELDDREKALSSIAASKANLH